MAKEIVVNKLIITFDNEQFKDGLVLYREKIDGVLGKLQKSISIKNMPFSKLHLADIIEKVITATKKAEGL